LLHLAVALSRLSSLKPTHHKLLYHEFEVLALKLFPIQSVLVGLGAALFVVSAGGCSMAGLGGPTTPELVLDPEPAAFSGDVAAFVKGKWSLSTKVSTQLPGVSSSQAAEMAAPDGKQYWVFLEGGRLEMHSGALPHKVGGTWRVEGSGITLTYTTYGGKPLETARQMLQAGAESGRSGAIRNEIVSDWLFQSLPKYTQVTLGDDKKTLVFAGGGGVPGMEALSEADRALMGKMMSETLVRMKDKG
jgi:hypothetical protein